MATKRVTAGEFSMPMPGENWMPLDTRSRLRVSMVEIRLICMGAHDRRVIVGVGLPQGGEKTKVDMAVMAVVVPVPRLEDGPDVGVRVHVPIPIVEAQEPGEHEGDRPCAGVSISPDP